MSRNNDEECVQRAEIVMTTFHTLVRDAANDPEYVCQESALSFLLLPYIPCVNASYVSLVAGDVSIL